MDPERWRKIERIYNAAMELEPGRRGEFLAQACGGDESLRAEIEALLASKSDPGDFMKSPALAFAARAAAEETSSEGVSSHSGRELSHYRIGELIGRGGMGEVYRAEDTRLRRQVAIKFLPADFARDPERITRLEREARVLASLNHPSIAGIHELEEADGVRFLVMELVEGKTLAEKLKKGPLTAEEALRICCRIAEGLEAAHGKGIIHRDLKPSNVKVAPNGKVKILDFGLAKALQGPDAADSQAVTDITDEMTKPGVILGTAAYMSPEQAKGQAVDKRADIWAFGCILFGCLTGKRAFPGHTVSETLAAVIKEEPDWSALPRGTPDGLLGLLKRCLRKDPEHRLHDIADVRIEMEEARSQVPAAESRPMPHRRRVFAAAGIAAVIIVFVAAGVVFLIRSRSTNEAPATVVPLITFPGALGFPTFSPDGNDIAFNWNGEKQDNVDIYRKMIGRGQTLRFTSDPAVDGMPAWSPDGRQIAFVRYLDQGRRGIFLLPALGGSEQKLTEITPNDRGSMLGAPCLGLAWSPDSRWLVTTDRNRPQQPSSSDRPPASAYGLHILSVETGEKRGLTSPPPGIGDQGASFSPDGRALAFVRILDFNRSEIYRHSRRAMRISMIYYCLWRSSES